MAEPGTITVKLVFDTSEAEAQIAALQAKAADLHAKANALQDQVGLDGGKVPTGPTFFDPRISGYIHDIAEKLDRCRISRTDADYLIACIRSRTR